MFESKACLFFQFSGSCLFNGFAWVNESGGKVDDGLIDAQPEFPLEQDMGSVRIEKQHDDTLLSVGQCFDGQIRLVAGNFVLLG